MLKKSCSMFLLAVLALTVTIGTASAKAHPYMGYFSDVKESDWFWYEVEACNTWGYMQGYPDGTFRPKANITRAEASALLESIRVDGAQVFSDGYNFLDVPKNAWYYNSVYSAGTAMGGFDVVTSHAEPLLNPDDSYFYPNRYATREEFVAAVYTVTDMFKKTDRIITSGQYLADADSISDGYRDAVQFMRDATIIRGDENGYFHSQASVTRAEAATIIYTLARQYWI